jgi:hypothetical protein
LAGRVIRVTETRNDTEIWWENSFVSVQLEDGDEGEILRYIYDNMDWVKLALDRVDLQASVVTVLTIPIVLIRSNY